MHCFAQLTVRETLQFSSDCLNVRNVAVDCTCFTVNAAHDGANTSLHVPVFVCVCLCLCFWLCVLVSVAQDLSVLPPDIRAAVARKVDVVIQLLRLTDAEGTFIGNEMIRGVSGGEKKRVTIAEMIMGIARVLVLGKTKAVACFT